MRVAVVGHVEWITFARVDRVPGPGEIAHATETWEEPGGAGGVAAVQLAKLAGSCDLFTAFGSDNVGEQATVALRSEGVEVHASLRDEATRRAVALIGPTGERTITTLGPRLEPRGPDRLPWDLLDDVDAVYVTAGDSGAMRHARRARVMVVTTRHLAKLAGSGVRPDAVVGSARDPAERYDPEPLAKALPRLVVLTEGADGGRFATDDGSEGRYVPAPLPGPIVDTYGGGDSFHAGLTYALGAGLDIPEALELAARCGAAAVAGRGPTGGQLTAAAP
jgi:ribokinase